MTQKLYKIPERECGKLNGIYDKREAGCIISGKHSYLMDLKSYPKYGYQGLKRSGYLKPKKLYNDINAMSNPLGFATTTVDYGIKIGNQILTCRGVVKDTAEDIRKKGLNSDQLDKQAKSFIEDNCGSEKDFWKFLQNELQNK